MAKKIPPDRDPQLREALALPDADQLALLHSMNGNAEPSAAQLMPVAPLKAARKQRRKRDFVHPKERPYVDDMLAELADTAAAFGHRFGHNRDWTGRDFAELVECEIYNSWVILQCLKHRLREPGKLPPEAYVDRFWSPDQKEGEDEAA